MKLTLKERLYEAIASSGIWFLSKFFPEYFAKDPLGPTDRYIEYPFVLSNLPSSPCKILDVGCSGSMLPYLLLSLGYDVTGIDLRTPINPPYRFVKSSICNTPFNDDTFDIVTAVSTIEHVGLSGRYGVKDDEGADFKAIEEIHRILKPDGKLFLTVPFGREYKVTPYHRIYSVDVMEGMLFKFTTSCRTVPSPEDNYRLALVEAIK